MSFANAQEPVRLVIDEKAGLPSNEVYAIEEDSNGFVWLATNKGLVRYDGSTFKNYKHPEQRGLSIFEPFVDAQDRLWCMNISGQIFYAQGENLFLFIDLKDDLNGSLASIVANDDYLIVSMYLKNIVINLKTKEKQIELFRSDNNKLTYNYGFNKSFDQKLYQSLNQHIRIFKNGKFSNNQVLPKIIFKKDERPEPIQLLKNEKKELFLLQQIAFKKPKIFKFINKKWQELVVPDSFDKVKITMPRFINNRLWCPTNEGLFIFSLKRDTLVQDAHYLKDCYATDLFQDVDHNIWVSTLRQGLVVFPNIYVKKLQLPERLPKKLIKTGPQELMIGFESGKVVKFDTKKEKKTIIDLPTNSAISNITHDAEKNRTFIFQKAHNYLYDSNDSTVSKIENTLNNVKNAAIVNGDTLMAALSGRLIITSINNNKFDKKEDFSFLKQKRGYSVLHDHFTKTQYFAAVDALYFKKDDGQFQQVLYNGNPILIKKLTQDKNGIIWASSFTNGIYKIKNNEVIQHISLTSGLNSLIINCIALQEDYLWIATENSLQQYHIPSGNVKSLNTNDGIPSFSIIDMEIIDNNIYMNTTEDVFQLDIEKVFKPAVNTEYYITEILINGKKQPKQSLYKVPDKETSTTINFNANGLRGLTSSTFEYRIKNYTDWTTLPQGRNSIQFASLPIGDITFQLKKSENSVIKEINFEVQQIFYKTLWFWALAAFILIFGIVFYYRRLLRFRESEKNKQLRNLALDNELVSLRLENLRSQMNPHFIFNALNSIQEYIVSNEKNLASSYLVKFSRLIRMYLEQSRENQISLDEEIHAMQLYLELEKVRFEDKLVYHLNIDQHLPIQEIYVPPLFIQPYVENALKHGLLHKKYDRNLHVNFSWNDSTNTLEICVEDNGIGREKAAVIKAERSTYHKSFATYANDERVELLNSKRKHKIKVEIQDLKSKSGDALGTKICIYIPQDKEYESNNNR